MKTMNRSFTHTTWFAAALAILSACQREDAPQNEQVPSGPVSVQVTIDQEATRTSVSEMTGAISFSEGDAIKIFDGTGIYLGITQSTGGSAMFVMENGFTSAGSGYAGFPADLVTNITSEGVTFNLPSIYEYSQVGGSNADAAKVPCPMVGTYDGGGGISLRPVCALVRFYLTDVAAGTLSFTFQGLVAGKGTVLPPVTGSLDGITQRDLGRMAYGSFFVTDVPEVKKGRYIYITLPVPVMMSPQYVVVGNSPADGSARRLASITGSSNELRRGHGFRFVGTALNPPAFSLSASTQVVFASGNLQYIGSADTPYFRFADHQWDYLGTTTGQNSDAADVDRDLFGWATSGYNNNNYPYTTQSANPSFYGPSISSGEWTSNSAEWDWGVHNTIANGIGYNWRTPTRDEWAYLLNTRSATYRYAKAQVHGINGLIIFPDEFTVPSGVAIVSQNTPGVAFTVNTLSDVAWSYLEQEGCVFLPAAGLRRSTNVGNLGTRGRYWSSTVVDSSHAYYMGFTDDDAFPDGSDSRYGGLSVRLVREVN